MLIIFRRTFFACLLSRECKSGEAKNVRQKMEGKITPDL